MARRTESEREVDRLQRHKLVVNDVAAKRDRIAVEDKVAGRGFEGNAIESCARRKVVRVNEPRCRRENERIPRAWHNATPVRRGAPIIVITAAGPYHGRRATGNKRN